MEEDQGSSKRIPGLAAQLIKHCFHPRALLSQSDADFTATFIQYLHAMGTPGFHTTAIYDKVTS
jgi:THO complex subunit 2